MKNLTEDKINEFIKNYTIRTGEDLYQNRLFKNNEQKANAYINRVYNIVLEEINTCNSSFNVDNASDYQNSCINNATLEQLDYMLTVGDFYKMSGYDPVTNNVISKNELNNRAFSSYAKKILSNSGLLYCGLRKNKGSTYLEERSYWGRMNVH